MVRRVDGALNGQKMFLQYDIEDLYFEKLCKMNVKWPNKPVTDHGPADHADLRVLANPSCDI